MDYNRLIKNSFTLWYRDSKTVRYAIAYFAVQLLFIILLISSVYIFFGPVVSGLMGVYSQAALGSRYSPQEVLPLFNTVMLNLLPFIAVLVPLFIADVLASLYLRLLMSVRALEQFGFPCQPFDFVKALKYIVLRIWVCIAAFISWYERRFMYAFLAIAALWVLALVFSIIATPVAILLVLLSLAASALYLFVILYNFIRLAMADAIFLEKEQSIEESTKDSWELSKGRAMDVLLGLLVPGIALVILILAMEVPLAILRYLIGAITNSILLGFAFEQAANLLLSPIWVSIGAYILPAVYLELRAGETRQFMQNAPQKTGSAPAPQQGSGGGTQNTPGTSTAPQKRKMARKPAGKAK